MMSILLFLGLAVATRAFPSHQQFDDDGFQPISPPSDLFYRGRSLPLEFNKELETSASGVAPFHAGDGGFRGNSGGFDFGGKDGGGNFEGKHGGGDFGGQHSGGGGFEGKRGGGNFGGKHGGGDFGGQHSGGGGFEGKRGGGNFGGKHGGGGFEGGKQGGGRFEGKHGGGDFGGIHGGENFEGKHGGGDFGGKRGGGDFGGKRGGGDFVGKHGGGDFGGKRGGGDFGGKHGGGDFGGKGGFNFGGKHGGLNNGGHSSGRGNFQGGNFHGGNSQHGGSTPTKTIYVNVPHEQQYEHPKPIVGGPPRKHYRIVFIKSPLPPPLPQPILPPRVEQKTLIYVLHPKAGDEQQQLIEVPENVQHDPEVYFIKYDDKPPTPEELQGLVKDSIDNYDSPSDLNFREGNFNNAKIPAYSGRGSQLKSAGSGVLKAKSFHKGYASQPLLPESNFGGSNIADGYSSSVRQGIGGLNGNSGARYNRTPKQPQNNVKFEGPFARSRYERSQPANPSATFQSVLGTDLKNADSFPFDKISNRDGSNKELKTNN